MKRKVISIIMSCTIVLTSSCASIVSRSSYPISINSTPSEAKIVITNKKGVEIYSGNTPATIDLKSGAGFFGKAAYQVKFLKDGYESKIVPVEFSIDGWYFGNIIFGGFLGLLIIDPATGAMYKLDTELIHPTLTQSVAASTAKEALKIYTIDEIPVKWKSHLKMIVEK